MEFLHTFGEGEGGGGLRDYFRASGLEGSKKEKMID